MMVAGKIGSIIQFITVLRTKLSRLHSALDSSANPPSVKEGVNMADGSPTDAPTTIRLYLYREGQDSMHNPTDTASKTVGALKSELGLSGSISVKPEGGASIIANDTTLLTEGCNVTVVGGHKTGG